MALATDAQDSLAEAVRKRAAQAQQDTPASGSLADAVRAAAAKTVEPEPTPPQDPRRLIDAAQQAIVPEPTTFTPEKAAGDFSLIVRSIAQSVPTAAQMVGERILMQPEGQMKAAYRAAGGTEHLPTRLSKTAEFMFPNLGGRSPTHDELEQLAARDENFGKVRGLLKQAKSESEQFKLTPQEIEENRAALRELLTEAQDQEDASDFDKVVADWGEAGPPRWYDYIAKQQEIGRSGSKAVMERLERIAIPGIHRAPLSDQEIDRTSWDLLKAAESGEFKDVPEFAKVIAGGLAAGVHIAATGPVAGLAGAGASAGVRGALQFGALSAEEQALAVASGAQPGFSTSQAIADTALGYLTAGFGGKLAERYQNKALMRLAGMDPKLVPAGAIERIHKVAERIGGMGTLGSMELANASLEAVQGHADEHGSDEGFWHSALNRFLSVASMLASAGALRANLPGKPRAEAARKAAGTTQPTTATPSRRFGTSPLNDPMFRSSPAADEPPLEEGTFRLYRGEGAGGAMGTSVVGGAWFTTSREKAAQFGNNLRYVDLPLSGEGWARSAMQGHGGPDEVMFPGGMTTAGLGTEPPPPPARPPNRDARRAALSAGLLAGEQPELSRLAAARHAIESDIATATSDTQREMFADRSYTKRIADVYGLTGQHVEDLQLLALEAATRPKGTAPEMPSLPADLPPAAFDLAKAFEAEIGETPPGPVRVLSEQRAADEVTQATIGEDIATAIGDAGKRPFLEKAFRNLFGVGDVGADAKKSQEKHTARLIPLRLDVDRAARDLGAFLDAKTGSDATLRRSLMHALWIEVEGRGDIASQHRAKFSPETIAEGKTKLAAWSTRGAEIGLEGWKVNWIPEAVFKDQDGAKTSVMKRDFDEGRYSRDDAGFVIHSDPSAKDFGDRPGVAFRGIDDPSELRGEWAPRGKAAYKKSSDAVGEDGIILRFPIGESIEGSQYRLGGGGYIRPTSAGQPEHIFIDMDFWSGSSGPGADAVQALKSMFPHTPITEFSRSGDGGVRFERDVTPGVAESGKYGELVGGIRYFVEQGGYLPHLSAFTEELGKKPWKWRVKGRSTVPVSIEGHLLDKFIQDRLTSRTKSTQEFIKALAEHGLTVDTSFESIAETFSREITSVQLKAVLEDLRGSNNLRRGDALPKGGEAQEIRARGVALDGEIGQRREEYRKLRGAKPRNVSRMTEIMHEISALKDEQRQLRIALTESGWTKTVGKEWGEYDSDKDKDGPGWYLRSDIHSQYAPRPLDEHPVLELATTLHRMAKAMKTGYSAARRAFQDKLGNTIAYRDKGLYEVAEDFRGMRDNLRFRMGDGKISDRSQELFLAISAGHFIGGPGEMQVIDAQRYQRATKLFEDALRKGKTGSSFLLGLNKTAAFIELLWGKAPLIGKSAIAYKSLVDEAAALTGFRVALKRGLSPEEAWEEVAPVADYSTLPGGVQKAAMAASFIRYPAQMGRLYVRDVATQQARLYGMNIGKWLGLDRAIRTAPGSRSAQAAFLARSLVNLTAKAAEWIIPIGLARTAILASSGISKKEWDSYITDQYKEHFGPVAWLAKQLAIPTGKTPLGRISHLDLSTIIPWMAPLVFWKGHAEGGWAWQAVSKNVGLSPWFQALSNRDFRLSTPEPGAMPGQRWFGVWSNFVPGLITATMSEVVNNKDLPPKERSALRTAARIVGAPLKADDRENPLRKVIEQYRTAGLIQRVEGEDGREMYGVVNRYSPLAPFLDQMIRLYYAAPMSAFQANQRALNRGKQIEAGLRLR